GFHQATWRGFYTRKDSRNGQTFSSLTGRTSGLPISVTEPRRVGGKGRAVEVYSFEPGSKMEIRDNRPLPMKRILVYLLSMSLCAPVLPAQTAPAVLALR